MLRQRQRNISVLRRQNCLAHNSASSGPEFFTLYSPARIPHPLAIAATHTPHAFAMEKKSEFETHALPNGRTANIFPGPALSPASARESKQPFRRYMLCINERA